MPEMDGIETTEKIRGLGYERPVVALTANAVSGQEELFFANGFDGFISKPIDMRQLNAALKKFVRDKQPPEVVEDAQRQASENNDCGAASESSDGGQASENNDGGAAMPAGERIELRQASGNNDSGAAMPAGERTDPRQASENNDGGAAMPVGERIDPQLAEFFVKDARRSVSVLEGMCEKNGVYEDADIQMYTTTVHAMKSALANIGDHKLSFFAAELEQAGRNKNADKISSQTPAFLRELKAIIEKLTPAESPCESSEPAAEDYLLLHETLMAIKEASKVYDKQSIKEQLSKLRKKTWSGQIKKLLDMMSEQLLEGDFYEVSSTADKLMKRILSEIAK